MIAQLDREMIRTRPSKVPGRVISYALIEGRPLTTSGQWINPLVFAGYRMAQVVRAPNSDTDPIFVVGTGRSGTTILGKLFALHRQTAFLNEPKALWHHAHGAEDIIGSYSTGEAHIRLPVPAAADAGRMAQTISRVYRWARFWSGAQRIVDKYPELIFRVPFVQSLFPGARLVAIIRDGVDTCSSVTNWSRRKSEARGDETHDWWGRNDRKWHMIVSELVPEQPDLAPLADMLAQTQDHRDRAAVEWIVSMRAVDQTRHDTPEMLHVVRYEDLCEQPESELNAIFDFCNIARDPCVIKYAETSLIAAKQPGTLELTPELVEPFVATLMAMGYEASVPLVTARQTLKS